MTKNDNENKNKFGKYLKEMREGQILSLRVMALDAGIGISTLSHIEQGRRGCDLPTLHKLANYLNLSKDKHNKLLDYYYQERGHIYIDLKKCTRKQRMVAHKLADKIREALEK